MNDPCGCCGGTESLTPEPIANRPGLPVLVRRIGTHSSFYESLQARLSNLPWDGQSPLGGLTTRDPGDPTLALLDAWSTVADVLTFYQERIANEGYLRTAAQRRSILELGRLIGYEPRPGVAASVHLAFSLDDGAGEVVIPAGTGAKSVPGQNETPQTFETSEDLKARPQWNQLKPRQARPHDIPVSRVRDVETLYMKGTSTNLELNDPLVLVVEGRSEDPIPRRVRAVTPDFENNRTRVELQVNLLSPARFQRRVLTAIDQFRQAPYFDSQLEQPSPEKDILRILNDLSNRLAPTQPLVTLDEEVHNALPLLEGIQPSVAGTLSSFGQLSTQIVALTSGLNAELQTGPATLKTELTPVLEAFWKNGSTPPADPARRVIEALRKIPDALSTNDEINVMRAFVTTFLTATLKPVIADGGTPPALKDVLSRFETRSAPTATDFGIRQIVSSFPNNTATVADHFKDQNGNVDFADEAFDPDRPPIGTRPVPSKSLQKGEFKTHVTDKISEFIGKADQQDDFVKQVTLIVDDITGDLALASLGPLAKNIEDRLEKLDQIATAADNANHKILAARIRDLRAAIHGRLQRGSIRLFAEVRDAYVKPADPGHEKVLTDLIDQIEPWRKPFLDALAAHPGPSDPLGTLSKVVAKINGAGALLAELEIARISSLAYTTGFSKFADALVALRKELSAAVVDVRTEFFKDIDEINTRFRFLDTFGDPGGLAKEAADKVKKRRDELEALDKLANSLRALVQPDTTAVIHRIHELIDAAETAGNRVLARRLRSLEFAMQVVVRQVTEASDITGGGIPQEFSAAFRDLLALAPKFQTSLGVGRFGRLDVKRVLSEVFAEGSDTLARIYQSLRPESRTALYDVWRNLTVERPRPQVFALRKRVSLFGYNAQQRRDDPKVVANEILDDLTRGLQFAAGQVDTLKANLARTLQSRDDKVFALVDPPLDAAEDPQLLFLDNAYEKILPRSYIAFRKPTDDEEQFRFVEEVLIKPRTGYGLSTQTTRLTLSEAWWETSEGFSVIRGTTVLVESEELELADKPIDSPEVPGPVEGAEIELDDLYEGLEAGRLMILSGERVDLARGKNDGEAQVEGIRSSEFVAVQGVKNDEPQIPGDKPHTKLILAEPLQHRYVRASAVIHGNVVLATHGETHAEVLGSGNASRTFEKFPLASPPLTYLPAFTAAGAASTLEVRVNDVRWREQDGFAGLTPTGRNFVTSTDNDDVTTVTFGDGVYGARLPTGVENVTAVYRSGIGSDGNAKADQISQLATQPLGVQGVINPLRASGGADRETRDQARRNAPLAVMALDRLISVQDYADFARTFAGIEKARAARLSDGRREIIHVTIAGVNDNPIDSNSQLFVNLQRALQRAGDTPRALVLEVREAVLLIIQAGVRIGPDFQWQTVEPLIRAKLLDTFSFARREPGQDVTASEIISTIHGVPGVSSVDLDVLHSVPETVTPNELTSLGKLLQAQKDKPGPRIRIPANLAGQKEHVVASDNDATETLASIAATYSPRTNIDQLKRLNPGLVRQLQSQNPNETSVDSVKLPPATRVLVSLTWPAQLVYLSPVEPNTLLLAEIPS